jgi:hypothetical protein
MLPMLSQLTTTADGCRTLVSFGGHKAVSGHILYKLYKTSIYTHALHVHPEVILVKGKKLRLFIDERIRLFFANFKKS